jgi:succinoglycan biosynthesis transport protein ExoP
MSPLQVLSILWRRAWIVVLTFASTMLGAWGVVKLLPPRYDAWATASIDPAQTDPVTGAPVGGTSMRLLQGNLVTLVKSHRVAVMVVKRLNLVANPVLVAQFRTSDAIGRVDLTEWIADDLLTRIEASFPEGTNVLVIKNKSNSAALAAQVANGFLAAFIDAAVEMKIASAQQTAQWFEPQTEKLRSDLAAARAKLAKFQEETQLLATGANDPESGPLNAVTAELSNARAQLVRLDSQLQATAADPTDTTDVQASDAPPVLTLRGQLHAIDGQIENFRTEVGANNSRVKALVAQRETMKKQLRTEIAAYRQQMVTRTMALKQQIESLEKTRSVELKKMIDVQAQRDQMATLRNEVELRQAQLQGVSKTASASRMQGQLSLSSISPLDPATPPVTPAFPKLLQIMLAGIGAGLGLGVIFALLAEAFDRRVRVVSDLEFAGQTAVLGTLLESSPARPRRLFPRRRRRKPALPAKTKTQQSSVSTRTRA